MRHTMWITAALAVLMLPPSAFSADVDDLQAAHEQYIQIINARDNPQAMMDTQLADFQVITTAFNPFFNVRSRKLTADNQQRAWSNYETFNARSYNAEYKVIGDTGLVWGHRRTRVKMRPWEKTVTVFQKVFMVFTKENGKWQKVAHNYMALPPSEARLDP